MDLVKKADVFDLLLNSASSFDLRDKQCIFIWILNVALIFLFSLDVIVESEDGKGIPLSIMPITDDLAFFEIRFQNITSG